MAKSLIELILLAMVFGTVQGAGAMPEEVHDQVVRRLPHIAAAAFPREGVEATSGLPPVEERDTWPRQKDEHSVGVLVSAASALVVDRDNGKVLFEKDADRVRPIASITKLMSALVFLETEPDLDAMLSISETEIGEEVSTIFALGDVVTGHDLLFAALVGSANDAARGLVRASGLDQQMFVSRMNEKARELGMMRARFYEPTGLDGRNVATVRDVVRLVQAVRDIPLFREAARQPVYRTAGSTKKSQFVRSTNLLLDSFLNQAPYRMVLAKTGSTDEAGFCFTASIDEGDHGVITVVLGSDNHFNRFEDTKALAYWALSKWEWE